jgi:uncharacterized protein (DUF58 family)
MVFLGSYQRSKTIKKNGNLETSELIKKVRKIEIKTRGLSRQIFAGEYHSAFKGRGMAFSEVRDYQVGDDIRTIDWNVTARFNHPYVKVYEEERELTVMLLVDVSGSSEFGSSFQMKKDLITEIAAVLSFSAIQNNDKIGVILFSDHVEKFIPPQKGRKHTLRIIRELLDFEAGGKGTDITGALRYLTNAIKKRCIAFMISDFMDFKEENNHPSYTSALRIAGNKHDMVGLKILDKREEELPPVGLLRLKDAESQQEVWVDTADKKTRENYRKWWQTSHHNIQETLKKSGVDSVDIYTDEDYVKPLMKLFKMRA